MGRSVLAVGFEGGSVGVEAGTLSIVSVGPNWVIVGAVFPTDVGKVGIVSVTVGRGLSVGSGETSVDIATLELPAVSIGPP